MNQITAPYNVDTIRRGFSSLRWWIVAASLVLMLMASYGNLVVADLITFGQPTSHYEQVMGVGMAAFGFVLRNIVQFLMFGGILVAIVKLSGAGTAKGIFIGLLLLPMTTLVFRIVESLILLGALILQADITSFLATAVLLISPVVHMVAVAIGARYAGASWTAAMVATVLLTLFSALYIYSNSPKIREGSASFMELGWPALLRIG